MTLFEFLAHFIALAISYTVAMFIVSKGFKSENYGTGSVILTLILMFVFYALLNFLNILSAVE